MGEEYDPSEYLEMGSYVLFDYILAQRGYFGTGEGWQRGIVDHHYIGQIVVYFVMELAVHLGSTFVVQGSVLVTVVMLGFVSEVMFGFVSELVYVYLYHLHHSVHHQLHVLLFLHLSLYLALDLDLDL